MIDVSVVKGKGWNSNAYLVTKDDQLLLIDTGGEYEEICKAVGDLKLHAILLTHGHYDHVIHAAKLQEKYRVPVYLHSGDKRLIKHANLYLKIFHGEELIKIPEIDTWIEDGQQLTLGAFQVQVLHTPGHTQGSVCFLIEDALFTGDLLFRNTIGRGDLPGGNEKKLKESLRRLLQEAGDVKVYAGHGAPTDLEYERQNNDKLKEIIYRENEH